MGDQASDQTEQNIAASVEQFLRAQRAGAPHDGARDQATFLGEVTIPAITYAAIMTARWWRALVDNGVTEDAATKLATFFQAQQIAGAHAYIAQQAARDQQRRDER